MASQPVTGEKQRFPFQSTALPFKAACAVAHTHSTRCRPCLPPAAMRLQVDIPPALLQDYQISHAGQIGCHCSKCHLVQESWQPYSCPPVSPPSPQSSCSLYKVCVCVGGGCIHASVGLYRAPDPDPEALIPGSTLKTTPPARTLTPSHSPTTCPGLVKMSESGGG